ncbi:hypothetical protein BDQ17DRAFT_1301160 [Cyathus striatus]|nr:hypothetical protein BDQ17DRAFT_1301160 [Cyathus striatus]
MTKLALFLLLHLAAASATHLRLLHRVFHPLLPHQSYLERATLHVSNDDLSVHPVSSLRDDVLHFSQLLNTPGVDTSDALYQVALQHPDDKSDAQWDISSVKACHLGQATAQILLLHSSSHEQVPFTFDYFVSPISRDGSCVSSKKLKNSNDQSRLTEYATRAFADNIQRLNISLVVQHPAFAPSPELRTPPPLSRDGEVVQPAPEKSFLQKYWMYIAAVMIALLMTGGPEEEQPRRPAQQ